ncbi:hypothetical protein Tco_0901171 [Tanacetum coccineum]
MGLQLLQLELKLGKIPSRSFRPVKTAKILWQFCASCSFRVSLAHDEQVGALLLGLCSRVYCTHTQYGSNKEGYPKETTGYYFYYPLENKIFVAQYAEFFGNSLISQEASGTIDFDEIQREDAQPSENTSQHQSEVKNNDVDPQTDVIPIHRSARIPQAPE